MKGRDINLLNRDEVADCLGTSVSTVVRLEKRGDLPRVKLGRLVRFRSMDVEALIQQHSENADGPASNEAVGKTTREDTPHDRSYS